MRNALIVMVLMFVAWIGTAQSQPPIADSNDCWVSVMVSKGGDSAGVTYKHGNPPDMKKIYAELDGVWSAAKKAKNDALTGKK